MSVVGPRPHMLRHTCYFSTLIKDYKFRHIVKPGITGWAQLNGYRGGTEEIDKMGKRVIYDREYIEKWNFRFDLNIIWKSVFDINGYKMESKDRSSKQGFESVLDTFSIVSDHH